MRTLLTLVLLLCAVSTWAQRPWMLRSNMTSGPTPTVISTSSSVYVFDTVAMRSFNHGANWEPVTGVTGRVRAVCDFTAGLSLLASYSESENKTYMYFSNGGAAWTPFTEIPNSAKPLALCASSTEWYLLCEKSNVLYRYADNLDALQLPNGAGITDVIYWDSKLLCLSPSRGLYVSADKGATWTLIAVPNATSIHGSPLGVMLSTNRGVLTVDISKGTTTSIGTWPGMPKEPRIADVDTYLNTVYAFADEGAFQLYALNANEWQPIGYPLPGEKAGKSSSVFAIDAGYAVIGHAISEGFVDSAGIYVYDLNDFTHVQQQDQTVDWQCYISDHTVHAPGIDHIDVDVWSVNGKLLHSLYTGTSVVDLPELTSGVYLIRIHDRVLDRSRSLLYAR